MDGARQKYDMGGVYKANQTKRILLSPNSGEKLLYCVKKLQVIKYKKTCQEKTRTRIIRGETATVS